MYSKLFFTIKESVDWQLQNGRSTRV